MSGVADVRSFALSLPETDEAEHMGSVAFRVRGKIFAQFADAGTAMLVKLSLAEQAELLAALGERAWLPDHWSKFGWTYIRIAGTPNAQVRALLERSWTLVAPKTLSSGPRKAAPSVGKSADALRVDDTNRSSE
jgi:hypothetical protein